MADASITARIGGDASGLVAALEQGKQAAAKFGDDFGKVMERKLGFKDVFKGILQGIGIASVEQIVQKLVAPFKDAADSAQRIEQYSNAAADATERMLMARKSDLQQLDALEKKLKAITTGQGEVKEEPGFMQGIANRFKGSALGRFAQYFAGDPEQAEAERAYARRVKAAAVEEEIAAKKTAIRGRELKEYSTLTSASERYAKSEHDRALERADDETKLKMMVSDKAGVDKEVAAAERFQLETRAQLSRQIAKYDAEISAGEKDKRNNQMSTEDLAVLNAQIKARSELVAQLDAGGLTADGIDDLNKKKGEQLKLENQITAATKKTADAQKDVTDEIKKLLIEKNKETSIAGIRGGNQFNNATDGALAEVARRNRAEADRIGSGVNGYGIGQDLEKAKLISEAMNAEKELKFRAKLRSEVAMGGVEGARRNFQGDPLAFDQVVSRLVEDNRSTNQLVQEQTDELVKIKNLLKGGIPTMSVPILNPGSR